jgi:hypothetical protein
VKTQPPNNQNSPSRWPVLPVLLGLDAFVLGGLATLLLAAVLLGAPQGDAACDSPNRRCNVRRRAADRHRARQAG